jgi:hypothetical protein
MSLNWLACKIILAGIYVKCFWLASKISHRAHMSDVRFQSNTFKAHTIFFQIPEFLIVCINIYL